jgi:hypothetical protein
MDRCDQRVRRTLRPFLLNFARPQPAIDLGFNYDAVQRLNVTAHDGVPVVATAGGRAMLKTLGVAAED